MTKFELFLNTLNKHARAVERVTRRKKRLSREDLEKILAVGSAVVSAVAVAVPQARIAAAALVSLQQDTTGSQKPKHKLQVVSDGEFRVQEKAT